MKGLFSRIGRTKPTAIVEVPGIDESVVGRILSPELFRSELADLGYDFEIFTDKDSKIWRFRRIPPKNVAENGDVW